MKAEREFVNQPTSVGQARRFVMDALSDVNGDALEDAAVMVSELASNCLRARRVVVLGGRRPFARSVIGLGRRGRPGPAGDAVAAG